MQKGSYGRFIGRGERRPREEGRGDGFLGTRVVDEKERGRRGREGERERQEEGT